MDRLAHNTKITRCIDATAAGTSNVAGTGIDMSGFNGACFVVAFGTITASAVTAVTLEQSSDDGASDAYSSIAGTSVSVADTDDTSMAYVDLIRPTKRYVRVYVTRSVANAVIDAGVCLQYGGHAKRPVTHDAATVANGEVHDDAAEGTA